MVTKSRHVNLLQSAETVKKHRSKLVDQLSELVTVENVQYDQVDRLLRNIEILSTASSILTKEADQPYTS